MSTYKNKSTCEDKDRSTARIEMKMDLEIAIIRTFMKTILIKDEGRVTTWVRVRVAMKLIIKYYDLRS